MWVFSIFTSWFTSASTHWNLVSVLSSLELFLLVWFSSWLLNSKCFFGTYFDFSDEKQFVEPIGLGPNLSSINFLAFWLSKLLYSSVPQSAILCKASLPMKQCQQYLFQKVWSIRELSKLPKKKGVNLYATGIIWYLRSLLS